MKTSNRRLRYLARYENKTQTSGPTPVAIIDRRPDPQSIIEVRKLDRDHIGRFLDQFPYDPYKDDLELFLREVEVALGEFPASVRRRVLQFRDEGNIDGISVIKGFPRDIVIPPTPTGANLDVQRDTYRAEILMGAIARAVGQPVGFLQEKEGRIFQHLYPNPDEAHKQTNGSSSTFLKFHTEVAFHRHLVDYVLLYGLRQDRERKAKTVVSSIRRIVKLLTLAQRRQLFIPQFRTRVDLSFGGGDGPVLAVLSGDPEDPFLRFDEDFMQADTKEGERALVALKHAINLERREVAIEPGDLVIIDNHRCVHGRSIFLPHYDGTDRWLLRLGVVRDLRQSAAERLPGTRIIATDCFD